MKKKDKIVGIVALYNPKNDEVNNIEKYIDELDYCFLMDDSGKDNSSIFQSLLQRCGEKVKYIYNETNLGLCASVNRAFKEAESIGADWVLVMNPDGTFGYGAVNIYREYIHNNDTDNVAIICPTYNLDRRPKVARNCVREVKYADMSGCLYNMKILSRLGYYDQNTYFYGLDTEYCMRVIRSGYKIIECSAALLNHNPAETRHFRFFGKIVFSYGFDNPTRFYYQFRTSKYIHEKYGLSMNDFFMVYKVLKVLLFFENKIEYFKMISKGRNDAKNGYFGPLVI